ncbi:MAG: ATP-dependent DNA helicase RecQ [Edaphocola sp.]
MLATLLKQYFGFDAFRPLQEEIIASVMEGKDTFALLPTGGGKSVCYQLPALAKDGFCLVVSPLIALMQDQVLQLRKRNIAAAHAHSGMTASQVADVFEEATRGNVKVLYVSPERLQTSLFQEYAVDFKLNLIAVDEAHCISQWGHDFRPAYRRIQEARALFAGVPVLALTASATMRVQDDIMQQLLLKEPQVFRQSVVRQNLVYKIEDTERKPAAISEYLKAKNASSIVYCRSRKRCADMAVYLQHDGLQAQAYHAGMYKQEREAAQAKWTASDHNAMCATTAFGMGIDKPNVRAVVHYDCPQNIEEYYQEAGRAGRDGKPAEALLYNSPKDMERLQATTALLFPDGAYIKQVYQYVGDYLKMPVGEGFEMLQPFDAVAMVQKFQLQMLPALSAIRLLDREGYWQWDEQANIQTTVQFITDSRTLKYLERTEPALGYIATGLLRIYGSIFHYPSAIREFDVARLLRIEKQQLDMGLQRLAALGIVAYQPGTNGGTLYWMHSRIAANQFRLDMRRIERLRMAHEERINAMVRYVEDVATCRNILLALYFGEKTPEACGQCDNCMRNQPTAMLAAPKVLVMSVIREQKELSVNALQLLLPQINKDELIATVRSLAAEGLCRISAQGVIFAF